VIVTSVILSRVDCTLVLECCGSNSFKYNTAISMGYRTLRPGTVNRHLEICHPWGSGTTVESIRTITFRIWRHVTVLCWIHPSFSVQTVSRSVNQGLSSNYEDKLIRFSTKSNMIRRKDSAEVWRSKFVQELWSYPALVRGNKILCKGGSLVDNTQQISSETFKPVIFNSGSILSSIMQAPSNGLNELSLTVWAWLRLGKSLHN
jgi:hypothetical protein